MVTTMQSDSIRRSPLSNAREILRGVRILSAGKRRRVMSKGMAVVEFALILVFLLKDELH